MAYLNGEGKNGVDWQSQHFLRQREDSVRISEAPVLEDITGELLTEVLSSLHFVGWRALSVRHCPPSLFDCPVIVFDTKAGFYDRFESYVS